MTLSSLEGLGAIIPWGFGGSNYLVGEHDGKNGGTNYFASKTSMMGSSMVQTLF